MDFAALQDRMGRGILRDDLAPYYGDYINDALQDIQNRYSFPCMRSTVNVTIPEGDTEVTVNLPANFKELQRMYFIDVFGNLIPGLVETEHKQIEATWLLRGWVTFHIPLWVIPFSVFYERYGQLPPSNVTPTSNGAAGVTAVVGMLQNRIEDIPLRVDFWGYLPRLVNPTDVSPLALAYPEMVIAKAKAVAFSTINDEEAYNFNMSLFNQQLNWAMRQDSYSQVKGKVCRL